MGEKILISPFSIETKKHFLLQKDLMSFLYNETYVN